MLAIPLGDDREMKRLIRYLCVFAAVGSVLGAGPTRAVGRALAAADPAADSSVAKAKLAEMRAQITALTNRLSRDLTERDARSARLREADLSITANRQQLEKLHAAQLAAERRHTQLSGDAARVAAELDAERAELAAQVRVAYQIGQQEHIQLLLNQSDPAAAGRMTAYYEYFARERARKIDEIHERVTRAQELVAQIDETERKLEALQRDTARQTTELQHARAERAAALADVSLQLSSGTLELGQLRREEQAEEALVADLARALQIFPLDPQQNFDTLRGKLAWPVQGRMTATRAAAGQAGLHWNGVLIETAHGAKVRAPYFGRVVYADWLQGLGLLLIIGHSGNYMTLYGHAEVLYKSVGDWVAPGDVIAALGDAGGAAPQLYFEIRQGRAPKDPKLWLKAAP